jgi:hypothetical protein
MSCNALQNLALKEGLCAMWRMPKARADSTRWNVFQNEELSETLSVVLTIPSWGGTLENIC